VQLSPDAKKLALIKREPSSEHADLWIKDLERKTMTRITFNEPSLIDAAFSPDSTRVAFSRADVAAGAVSIEPVAGGPEQKLAVPGEGAFVEGWTPDGKYVVASNQDPKTRNDLYLLPVDGGKPIPLLTHDYDEFQGRVSPNGKWLLYLSDETGSAELYVTGLPNASGKWQVSRGGANWARWSRDGKRLYFGIGDKLLSAEVSNPDTMELGATQEITTLESTEEPVDFAPDGRLLVRKRASGQRVEPMRMVLHFTEALPR
jgi:eukaryotic-like serine/threonine-protein kinase